MSSQTISDKSKSHPVVASRPLVAIVGRPNVGKSTFFNALVRRRKAIISQFAGTTRDRLYGEVTYQNRHFSIVDTGGLFPDMETPLEKVVEMQAKLAIAEADIILMLTDATTGLIANDIYLAQALRQSNKPVILLVNKVDSKTRESFVPEFFYSHFRITLYPFYF